MLERSHNMRRQVVDRMHLLKRRVFQGEGDDFGLALRLVDQIENANRPNLDNAPREGWMVHRIRTCCLRSWEFRRSSGRREGSPVPDQGRTSWFEWQSKVGLPMLFVSHRAPRGAGLGLPQFFPTAGVIGRSATLSGLHR